MTPKEKAEQLYRNFYSKTMISRVGGIAKKRIALTSALLCVEEIQEHAQMIESPYEGYSNTYQYFLRVIATNKTLKQAIILIRCCSAFFL